MIRATRLQRPLASQFAFPVHILRIRHIRFGIRAILDPIENVIGRVVNDQRPSTSRFIAQYARRDAIDRLSQLRLRLRLVYHGIRRRIDDNVWLYLRQHLADSIRIRQIAIMPVYRNHFAQWRQGSLQLKTDLTIPTGKEDPHRQTPYCLPSHSR